MALPLKLKFLGNSWNVINCEINLILTWSENCVISSATGAAKFKITDTKIYVPVAALLTEDNAKLLKSGLEEELIGTNVNQKFHQKDKMNI